MNKNPRRKVIRWELRENRGESRNLFPVCASAVLECGHVLNVGVSAERPKTMACYECGTTSKP